MNPDALRMSDVELKAARQRDREIGARIRTEVPDEVDEDQRRRAQSLKTALMDVRATVEMLGHLAGDRYGNYGSKLGAVQTKRLLAEIEAGRLKSNDDLRFYADGQGRGPKRGNPATVRVSREAFALWLRKHGTDADRATAAAAWARGDEDFDTARAA